MHGKKYNSSIVWGFIFIFVGVVIQGIDFRTPDGVLGIIGTIIGIALLVRGFKQYKNKT